jgi:anti-anti-sigma factor
MKLKRLSDDADAVRLQVLDRIINGDPSSDFSEVADLLGDRGYNGQVLLSLVETESIDSSGLSWLLECHKRFSGAGGKLVLHSIPPSVMDTMMMMRLELVLRLAEDEPAALEILRGDNP